MVFDLSTLDLFQQRVLRVDDVWRIETWRKDTGEVVDRFDMPGADQTNPTTLLADVGRRRMVELAMYGPGGPGRLDNVAANGGVSVSLPSTGYDQTSELQQLADDTYASLGGTSDQNSRYNTGFAIKLVDGQEYAISQLVMPPGMTLTSVSGALTPFSDKPGVTSGGTPVSAGPILRHISPNQSMLMNDTTRGIDRTAGFNRFSLNTISGLTMVTDRFASSRRGDANFVFWRSAFGLDLIGNSMFTSAGFGLKTITCNAMRVRDNYCLYAPWFLSNAVDSQFSFNQIGGGNGFASDSVWISGNPDASQFSRLNLWFCNMIYNNNSNGNFGSQYAKPVNIAGISGDTITLDTDVGLLASVGMNWIGETPVCITTTGTLPTATGHTMAVTRTYWVTVLPAGNQIKLSTSRENKAAAIYLSFTDAGSGNKLRVGGNANIHLNAGSRDNIFTSTRPDQSFGDAILLDGAPNNVFQGTLIAFSRAGNAGGSAIANGGALPVAGPAVTIRNGSTGAQFTSGDINGEQHTDVGVGPSNQKFAFSVDNSSVPGFSSVGMRCINHTAANSEAGAQAYENAQLNPRRIVLQPTDFVQVVATAVVGISLGARLTLQMAPNGTTVAANVRIPADWLSIRARVQWANNGTANGTVTWAMRLGNYALGENTSATEQTLVTAANVTVPVGGDQYLLRETVIELGSTQDLIGDYCAVRLIRSDAAGPTLQVLNVILEEAV